MKLKGMEIMLRARGVAGVAAATAGVAAATAGVAAATAANADEDMHMRVPNDGRQIIFRAESYFTHSISTRAKSCALSGKRARRECAAE
jgi:hypothetical protein